MKLFTEELYKIWSRKIVKTSFVVILFCIIGFFYVSGPANERSLVSEDGGMGKSGFAAITQDRELAEKYKGYLTDEMVTQMAKDCYFIRIKNEIQVNRNYVNTFFSENGLTNGDYKERGQYREATATIPIAESDMGSLAGKPVYFAYMEGWKVFFSLLSFSGILTGILVMIAVVPVFSEEYSLKTAPLLLTTEHGKGRDIAAKIGASAFFSVSISLVYIALQFLLCGFCYGFGGLRCFAGMLEGRWALKTNWIGSVSYLTIWQFFLIFIGIFLIGILMLCAFCLLVSAVCKHTYVALLLSIIFYVMPVVIWLYTLMTNARTFLLTRIMYCTPVYACMSGAAAESLARNMLFLRGIVICVVVIPSIYWAVRWYRNCH